MRLVACVLAGVGLGARVGFAQPAAPWVAVTGQVVLPAEVPVPGPRPLAFGPIGLLDESVVVNPANRGVKNVVVWLRPDTTDLKATFAPGQIHPADARRKPKDVVIDQPLGLFDPRSWPPGRVTPWW